MATLIALVYGLNVGGKSRLAMAELRAMAEELGYSDVATYVQSGNLVFRTGDSPAQVAAALEGALAKSLAKQPRVFVRSASRLARIVADNPFLERSDDPKHHHVVFCGESMRKALGDFELSGYAPEEAHAAGKEVYLYLPGGLGRSKLAGALLGRRGVIDGTARNWRTTTRLLEMAQRIGG